MSAATAAAQATVVTLAGARARRAGGTDAAAGHAGDRRRGTAARRPRLGLDRTRHVTGRWPARRRLNVGTHREGKQWQRLTTARRSAARGCRSPDEADIDEFVDDARALRARRDRPDEWRAFRLVRGTYGQRQTGDAQMLRVKIPQGILLAAAARRARRRRRALLARLRPHHHAAEHPVPLRQAARRRAGDAPARRRRADDARGVRQLGAQHHRPARTPASPPTSRST